MKKGRMPACRTINFAKGITTSGHSINMSHKTTPRFEPQEINTNRRTDNIHKYLIDQGLCSGNRIGHNPLLPKTFTIPSTHKRPISLLDVIRSFSESYFKAAAHKTLYYHFDKDGLASRRIRSEFREMISMGCSILTHYYDVIRGEIGFWGDKGQYVRLSYGQLASKLNVSLIRVKRFFKFLKDRKFVTIVEDKKKNDKNIWQSNVSKKAINPSFFINTLGIDAWKKIVRFKEWLYKKSKPKTEKEKNNVSMLKALFSPIRSKRSIKNGNKNQSYLEKQLVEKALILYDHDPSKSLSEYLKELKSAR